MSAIAQPPLPMKAVYSTAYAANLSSVKVGPRPAPRITPGMLLVAVAGSSVNPIDLKVLDGSINATFPLTFPHTLTRAQRAILHTLADELGLEHASNQVGPDRQLVISL